MPYNITNIAHNQHTNILSLTIKQGDSGAPSSPLRSKISARLQGQHQLKAAEKVRNASTIALSVWSVSGKRVVDLCASKSTTTHNNKMGPTSDTSPAPGVVPSEFAMVACPTLEAAMSVLATARKRATGSLTHPEGSSTADRGYVSWFLMSCFLSDGITYWLASDLIHSLSHCIAVSLSCIHIQLSH